MAWELRLLDGDDYLKLYITEDQARRFMAGEGSISFDPSSPEYIEVADDGSIRTDYDARELELEEEDYPRG